MPKRINHTKNHHIVWIFNKLHQEEFYGFTDLDVAAASEKADSLRKEGDLLKHDLAEARAHKVGTENLFTEEKYFSVFFLLEKYFCPPPVPLPSLVSFSS